MHQPHNAQDDPNNTLLSPDPDSKLVSPWRGPYQVHHFLSEVVDRVWKDGQSDEVSVHLGRMKAYHQRSAFIDPDFEQTIVFFF